MPTTWAVTWCGCPCGTGQQVGVPQQCLLPQPSHLGCSSFPQCTSAQCGAGWAQLLLQGSELGAVFLLMPLSFQPTKERLWDKPSYRKPSSVSLKAPLQFDSRAPLHPERGPGKNPCCPPCSRHQLSSAADLRGICHGHAAHWWCRSSLRPTSSPNRTYLWFCLSAVCFQMPQTLGMAKATQSPWKT